MNAVLQRLQDVALVRRPTGVSSGRSRPANRGAKILKRAESAVQRAEQHLLGGLTHIQRQGFRSTLILLTAQGGDPTIDSIR